jgi:type VI secretion system protein ImpK
VPKSVPTDTVVNNESVFHPRRENLPSAFQEVLTAVMRLRTNRQSVTDPQLFRMQMEEAVKIADREAKQRGYSAESVRLAVFAVVAFVDESVMNQRTEVFADWAREPLQLKLFGVHVAGEIFFENIQRLLVQADHPELADLLELHQLCLLLGYRGRYGTGSHGEVRTIIEALAERIRRIRGPLGELSPAWRLPLQETIQAPVDSWGRRLTIIFACCFVLAILLFLVFNLSLRSGLSTLRNMAGLTYFLGAVPAPPLDLFQLRSSRRHQKPGGSIRS